MRNTFEVSIPKHVQPEVENQEGLKSTIFTRTRVALFCLVLVVALGIGSTFSYVMWTSNQTPNRAATGDVELHVVETLNGATAEVTDSDSTFKGGATNKQVKLRAGDDPSIGAAKVRVTFLPVVASAENASVSVAFGENWSEAPVTDTTGTYISTDVVKLYINPKYADYWEYSDGTFTSKGVLNRGETTPVVLMGAALADGVSASDYGSIKVDVIADAIQEGTSDTW